MDILSTALDPVVLGRWQFGVTTVYHFILVPLTIGLSLAVAIMQTIWHKTGNETWLKATRFFGKLLLINFALGVATGIVQEFQFGMNWSEYSRYVGDIFGAPLAVEALLAFFLESTFLGLWIFGWGRISKKLHLATIWLVAIGTTLSALWILTANSWMQHPVGAVFNPATGRAELDGVGGFGALLTNPVLLWTFTHVISSAWLITGTFIAGISIWWMTRSARDGGEAGVKEARQVWRPITAFGLGIVVVGGVLTAGTGHFQGQEMVELQPMKMATAEAICVDTEGAAFTVAAFGECPLDGDGGPMRIITVPGVASLMASNSFTSEEMGVQGAQQQLVELLNADPNFVAKYGDAAQYDFRPPAMPTFWSFRLMIGTAAFAALLAIWGLWAMRGGRIPTSRGLGRFGIISIPVLFIGASFGWIFTEMGRQPWVVSPNLMAMQNGDPGASVFQMTEMGISTSVPAAQTLITLILFTVLYAVLGVIWVWLMRRYVLEGIDGDQQGPDDSNANEEDSAQALSFGY
ncbi:cytochrome ubiquinol oxidase subunit I [Actinomycetaceae bacterium MB13-C1-2]|nr:cytochrome ubiquinol oxidase subunit I [Actinomycetaceae bacterium MB13-C1-2]